MLKDIQKEVYSLLQFIIFKQENHFTIESYLFQVLSSVITVSANILATENKISQPLTAHFITVSLCNKPHTNIIIFI